VVLCAGTEKIKKDEGGGSNTERNGEEGEEIGRVNEPINEVLNQKRKKTQQTIVMWRVKKGGGINARKKKR